MTEQTKNEVIEFIANEMEFANRWGNDFGVNRAVERLFGEEGPYDYVELTEEQQKAVDKEFEENETDILMEEAECVFEECENWSFVSRDFDALLNEDGVIDWEIFEYYDELDYTGFGWFLDHLDEEKDAFEAFKMIKAAGLPYDYEEMEYWNEEDAEMYQKVVSAGLYKKGMDIWDESVMKALGMIA